jgi:hypothetical protein
VKTIYPALKQLDTRARELIEEINEIALYLEALDERDVSTEQEPPQLSC